MSNGNPPITDKTSYFHLLEECYMLWISQHVDTSINFRRMLH